MTNRVRTTVLIMPMISMMMTAAISAEAAQKRAAPTKSAPRPVTPVAPVAPPKPLEPPYAMRGVALGIRLDEWRAIPVIADQGETNLQRYCTGEPKPSSYDFDYVDSADTADGIISCQWFGTRAMFTSTLFISLGSGMGPPVFQFIKDETGTPRLFRIEVFANSTYYAGILDALTRNYGTPVVTTKPFQTNGGATFEQTISIWDNGGSTITMIEPCRRTQRYCLTYRHTGLSKLYDALVEKRAAGAAGKI